MPSESYRRTSWTHANEKDTGILGIGGYLSKVLICYKALTASSAYLIYIVNNRPGISDNILKGKGTVTPKKKNFQTKNLKKTQQQQQQKELQQDRKQI